MRRPGRKQQPRNEPAAHGTHASAWDPAERERDQNWEWTPELLDRYADLAEAQLMRLSNLQLPPAGPGPCDDCIRSRGPLASRTSAGTATNLRTDPFADSEPRIYRRRYRLGQFDLCRGCAGMRQRAAVRAAA